VDLSEVSHKFIQFHKGCFGGIYSTSDLFPTRCLARIHTF